MTYNLYEIAEIYEVSRQFIQRKYKEFKSNCQATHRQPKATKKNNRLALQNADLTSFVEFLGYNVKQLPGNPQATNKQPISNQKNQLFNKFIAEKSEQIKYLKKQIELLQNEKDKMVDLHNREKQNLIDDLTSL